MDDLRRAKAGNSQSDALPRRVAIYLFLATIAAAPLPFGSVNPIATAIWSIALGAAVVTLSLYASQSLSRGHLTVLAGVAVVVAGYGFVLHEQLAANPWLAKPNAIWDRASAALGVHINPSTSILRGEPLLALGPALSNVLALICGMLISADYDRSKQIVWTIAYSGLAYAIYGILSFLIDPTSILWFEKRAYFLSLTGTFVNRNTAAAFFGSVAVVWLCLLLDRVRRRLPAQASWKLFVARILSAPPRKITLSFLALFVCLMAMFLTASRAGVLISLFVLVLTFGAYLRRDRRDTRTLTAALVAGGVAALLMLQIMGDLVSTRLESRGLTDQGRLEAYWSTLRMIGDHPWFGTGLGTFAWSFPPYRSSQISMWGVWDVAHNTPLEVAAELGLPLTALIVSGWVALIAILAKGIRTLRRGWVVPLSALGFSAIGMLHSFVDFTLQIPGYSMVAFALVGAGIGWSLAADSGVKKPDLPII